MRRLTLPANPQRAGPCDVWGPRKSVSQRDSCQDGADARCLEVPRGTRTGAVADACEVGSAVGGLVTAHGCARRPASRSALVSRGLARLRACFRHALRVT